MNTPLQPTLTIVAAMGENRVIGNHGELPWEMPADLAHFKALTVGKPVIMGSKTFRAIGRPLPKRINIVLSRSNATFDGATTVSTVEAAIDVTRAAAEICIIGGQQIFELFLPQVSKIELTVIHTSPEGDSFFPALEPDEWKITNREEHEKDDHNAFDYTFLTYERIA